MNTHLTPAMMISLRQLTLRYNTNWESLSSAFIRLNIPQYTFGYIKKSHVPLLDNYFNYRG